MNRVLTAALAFVLTLVLVLGAAAGSGLLTTGGIDDPARVENPQYDAPDLVKNGTPGTATVTMDGDAEPRTVVVDPGVSLPGGSGAVPPQLVTVLGAGLGTTERDLSPLLDVLVENGHRVRLYSPPQEPGGGVGAGFGAGGAGGAVPPGAGAPGPGAGPGTPARPEGLARSPLGRTLADADAFVTFRTDYSDAQLADIRAFEENDGRVLLATDPDETFGPPAGAALKTSLNVTTGTGYVYNMDDNDLNYQRIFAEPAGDSPLFEGVSRVVLPTAGPVGAAEVTGGRLVPTEGAELSTTRASTEAPVMVRSGGVVLVGDSNFLRPENVVRADNDVLVGNLAEFLVGGDRTPGEQPPLLPGDVNRTTPGPGAGPPVGPTPPGGSTPPGTPGEPTPTPADTPTATPSDG